MAFDEAVVLAAGEGQRLRPLTRHRPKPMLPAANRPILEYVFDALIDSGVTRIHTVVGYKRDRVQNHFGSTYRNARVEYVAQNKQLGSGHALLQASGRVSEPFLVVNGDQIVTPGIIADVVESARSRGGRVAEIAVVERDEVGEYGAVELDGGRVTALIEKPQDGPYHLLNAGVYAFDTRVFDALAETPRAEGELALPDTIAGLIADGAPVHAVRSGGLWIDATYPWDLLTVARELLAAGWIDADEEDADVWVAGSATIHEDAVLEPPVVVGADCVIGPGAVVGQHTALGRNVTVGANAVVEGSVLDDDTRVGAGCTVLECVTGQSVRLGGGTVVPSGLADVIVAGRVHSNQRLGAVLADRVVVDGGVGFAPGTLVGPNAHIRAGARVSGEIPADVEVLD